jgi:hypothetical protein
MRQEGRGKAPMQLLADGPRATRYAMSAPLVYRCVGEGSWLAGRTVNVSRTGVLFQAVPPALPAATRIEFILALPSLGLPGASRVQCQGRIVRHCAPTESECAMAATIDAYDFLGVAPEATSGRVDVGRSGSGGLGAVPHSSGAKRAVLEENGHE